jgi:tRNA pseudouridine38-40 synthase
VKTFCIRIAYDGTNYAGWQRQSNVTTIQSLLEHAAQAINGEPTSILGSGRTDAGVHAEAQAACFRTPRAIDAERVPHALNAHLPDDVVVTGATEVDAGFHPIRDAAGKRYRYTLRRARFDSPFDRNFVERVADPLDISRMRAAARHLVGRHDFAPFEKSGSPRPSTVRTLRQVDVVEAEEYIHFDIEGDGFLYGMARNLAGTLLRSGRRTLEPDTIPSSLLALDRSVAGPCLPARGLRLMQVFYPFDGPCQGEPVA